MAMNVIETKSRPASASGVQEQANSRSATPAEPEKAKSTRKRIIDAMKLKKHAVSHGHWADHKAKNGDRIGYLGARHDADQMHQRADADLTRWAYTTRNQQPPGNGGELTPLPEPEDTYRRDFKRMMVEELPDVLTHQASSDAMNLLADMDVLPAGLEMANSIKARNRPERMLAHEAATFHTLAMKFAARANVESERAARALVSEHIQYRQIASIEACRNLNAAARAATAMNDALLTLHKLRTGGKQVVQVQHVTVKDGQAIVGQNVEGAGRARKPSRALERKPKALAIEDNTGGLCRRGKGGRPK